MKKLVVGVSGSRSLDESENTRHFMRKVFDKSWERIQMLVSGGCQYGPDKFAYEYAIDTGIEFYTCTPRKYPNYPERKYDRGCNFRRNTRIVEKCDVLLAFYDGISKGTRDTIDKAIRAGKKTVVYTFDSETGEHVKTEKHNYGSEKQTTT